MIILFNSKLGLETVIHHISTEKYGKISQNFKTVLNDIKNGYSIRKALEKLRNETKSTNFKRIIDALETCENNDTDISKRLENISQHILDEKKIEINIFNERLNVILTTFTIILLIPIITQTFKLM
ncbi:MAG: type II secretion system F family protein [DPANN group archaeon]|nr:type II secretion system F family protein [DPANN group archaeon]